MKTYRSTFEENFKAVPELRPNKQGVRMRYVYIGLWYVWNVPQPRVRAIKRLFGAACVLSVLLFFAGGLVSSPLNYNRYVQLPGMLSLAALVFEVFGVGQFCAAKEQMNCMDFRDIRGKLLIAPLAHGVLLFCTAAVSVWQMISSGFTPVEVVIPLCYLCSGLLSLAIFLKIRNLPYRTDKNKDALIGLDNNSRESPPEA